MLKVIAARNRLRTVRANVPAREQPWCTVHTAKKATEATTKASKPAAKPSATPSSVDDGDEDGADEAGGESQTTAAPTTVGAQPNLFG